MNILLVVQNNSFPFDTRVFNEAKSLKNNFKNIFVVCPKTKIEDNGYEDVNGIKVYRYKDLKSNGSILGFLIEYANAFLRIFVLSFFIVIRKKIKIMHFANPPDIFWPIILFLKLFRVRSIYDQHDLVPELYKIKFTNKIYLNLLEICEKLTFKFADGIIFSTTSFYFRMNRKYKIFNKPNRIIYSGPENNFSGKFNPYLHNKYKDRFVALYVGLMSTNDNLEIIIKLAKELVFVHFIKDVIFILVGDGEVRLQLEKLVKKNNLSDNFHFTGIVDRTAVKEYLSIADLCLMPDQPNGFNEYISHIKTFEYMKSKNAFIAFNLTETRKVAKNSALYSTNFSDYVNNFIYLKKNPHLLKEMGEIGFGLVNMKYIWEKQEKKIFELYSLLLN